MTTHGDYRGDHVCVISGAKTNLKCGILIQNDVLEREPDDILALEWVFGIQKGGLKYYLDSRDNYVPLREDICRLFCRGEFILAPTFETYVDIVHFVKRAGIQDRRTSDRSPRRPLTALASSEGMYRYVFIPRTDAARKLQAEFSMAPQTAEDLNHGIYPLSNAPYKEGTEDFPVVECHAHPFSVAIHAYERLFKSCTRLSAQWLALAWDITQIWSSEFVKPPQWFLDSPEYSLHDEDLSPSEATGYLPALPDQLERRGPIYPRGREVIGSLRDCKLPEDSYPDKCAKWAFEIPPDAPPPEEDPPCAPYRERRSSAGEDCGGPLPSPTRKGRRALQTCKRDPVKNPPWWASRNGRYPTERFCSNDWASKKLFNERYLVNRIRTTETIGNARERPAVLFPRVRVCMHYSSADLAYAFASFTFVSITLGRASLFCSRRRLSSAPPTCAQRSLILRMSPARRWVPVRQLQTHLTYWL
ncbi:hypothetical protein K525DRAFT_195974 [Schizophyllum commune Loenen D]|nr:hypothetical protein K525DRAFT_195974 [Schizophyllum commune Loenen D]